MVATDRAGELAHGAARLARAFDDSFATVPAEAPATESFLALRVGGDRFALSMAEVCGVFPDRRITPLPGAAAELVGVVAIRGKIVPAYALRAFLGYPADLTPRWVALAGKHGSVALGFDRLDGYLRVGPEDVQQSPRTTHHAPPTIHPYLRSTVRTAHGLAGVVDIAAVLDEIKRRSARQGSSGVET